MDYVILSSRFRCSVCLSYSTQERHTFATLALTAGVDIYTTSQLLGHANIRHTQRYAQIINSKKDHAVSLLDDAFIQ